MPRINLLPWREQQRKERKLAFFVALGGAAVGAVLMAFAAYLMFNSMIGSQEDRNNRLRTEIKQKKPFATLQEEVFLALLRTADHLAAQEAELLKQFGVTPAQYNVLRILRGHRDTGLCGQRIAAEMVTQTPDIPRLVDRLEAAGHVDVPDDVRSLVAAGGGVLEERRGAEGVVVVSVGVDDVADRQIGEAAELLHHPGAVGEQAGVDDGDGVGPQDQRGVPEPGEEVDARTDLGRLMRRARLAQGLGSCGLDGVRGRAHGSPARGRRNAKTRPVVRRCGRWSGGRAACGRAGTRATGSGVGDCHANGPRGSQLDQLGYPYEFLHEHGGETEAGTFFGILGGEERVEDSDRKSVV